jgi:hypothetical protein
VTTTTQYLSAFSFAVNQIGVGSNQDLSGILGFNNIYHATPAFGYEFLGNTISSFVDGKIAEMPSVDVPTKVSELSNDVGYITSEDVVPVGGRLSGWAYHAWFGGNIYAGV